MGELLLELFSEEIPARMQAAAARDLERLMVAALGEAGLEPGPARAFATPRRLALVIDRLMPRQKDVTEERKGPRVNAPDAALQGFLKSTGLSKDALNVVKDPKGDFYVAVTERKGRPAADVIAEIVPEVIAKFPWPKSMRSGASPLTWVRPLHRILCVFAGDVVPFSVGAIRSGDATLGHRFLSQGEVRAHGFNSYKEDLRKASVILDADERKAVIAREARKAASEVGCEFIEDEGLLEEVAGLTEWPVIHVGTFDRAFLEVPQEILISTMRANQKYFALRDPRSKRLAEKFVITANMVASDGGRAIVSGNQRVLRARLSDAKFFWDQDKRETLDQRVEKLKPIVFHEKLGSQYMRALRIERLAGEIAGKIGADTRAAARAGRLAKADLVAATVGEFPEVQGIIGGHLARHEGLGDEVADAIAAHYSPKGPSDDVPVTLTAAAVALADKADTLTGFWAIDEKPTGSKDPFALRRAALGLVRIILERNLRLPLRPLFLSAFAGHLTLGVDYGQDGTAEEHGELKIALGGGEPLFLRGPRSRLKAADEMAERIGREELASLLTFIAERLKVVMRDGGARHDLVDAVFALAGQDDLFLIVKRISSLGRFLQSEDGANLLAGYRRAANILKIEEKKDKRAFSGHADPELLKLPEEQALFRAIAEANDLIEAELERERFDDAMAVLSRLRSPVDAFFDKVTVNADEAGLRENRLKLLAQIRNAMHLVADFSRVEGSSS